MSLVFVWNPFRINQIRTLILNTCSNQWLEVVKHHDQEQTVFTCTNGKWKKYIITIIFSDESRTNNYKFRKKTQHCWSIYIEQKMWINNDTTYPLKALLLTLCIKVILNWRNCTREIVMLSILDESCSITVYTILILPVTVLFENWLVISMKRILCLDFIEIYIISAWTTHLIIIIRSVAISVKPYQNNTLNSCTKI